MFFAHIKNAIVGDNGGGIYYENAGGKDSYFRDVFCPDTEIKSFISFHAYGSTYAERRESIRNAAIDFQAACSEYQFSYSELAVILPWFEKMGKRYGLLREFQENGIC